MEENLGRNKFNTRNFEQISNKKISSQDEKINQFFNELNNDIRELDNIFEECDIILHNDMKVEDKWNNLINDILE